jgi:hypothetical protein
MHGEITVDKYTQKIASEMGVSLIWTENKKILFRD